MDQDVNLLRFQSEQPMSFDDLQPLVHERCRIDGDPSSHLPYRMLEGLHGSYGIELSSRGAEEGAAGARQNQTAHLVTFAGSKALMNRAVLTVDGKDLHSPLPRHSHHQFAGNNQNLFISQAYRLTSPNRLKRRFQAGHALGSGNYEIHVGKRRGFQQPSASRQDG